MPAMTTAEKTEAANLRSALETAKTAVTALIGEFNTAQDMARTSPTFDKLMGEAAMGEAAGLVYEAYGKLKRAHGIVAAAALTYSAADGQTIVMGGSRR